MDSESSKGPVAVNQVRELFDRYVATLDRAEMDDWLALFSEDGYYAVLRQQELEQDNNVLLIGEDMKRLRARISSGRDRDKRRMVHMYSGVRVSPSGDEASAAFAMWFDGIPGYAGRYLLTLEHTGASLRIRRCTVVLDNELVNNPIYMPI